MTTPQDALDGVRGWMEAHFPAAPTTVEKNGTAEVYVFEVEQHAPSPTLLIAQEVFDHHSVEEILTALDHDRVADRLHREPRTRLLCVEPDGRIRTVEQRHWRRSQP